MVDKYQQLGNSRPFREPILWKSTPGLFRVASLGITKSTGEQRHGRLF